MVKTTADRRYMAAALALSTRGRGRTGSNPNVGCVVVREGTIIGRGWTQPGGRPHAEAEALAGIDAAGADVYVTLEPCAHSSDRGPACTELLLAAAPARLIIGAVDPDPRTKGKGVAQLRDAGIDIIEDVLGDGCRRAMAGFFSRITRGRPYVTLKLATSLDGKIALPDGSSQWITGSEARAHAHIERAQTDVVVVGRATAETDTPRLDVRLRGLSERTPARAVLTHDFTNFAKYHLHADQPGWLHIASPAAIAELEHVNDVLIEGGAGAAAAFLESDLVDRLLLYRAPILIGKGLSALADIGLAQLESAHDKWRLLDTRMLGKDRLEVYERA
jgi:diaminohydroxyphosphoribosylaminopyrimidine deaminase/5-amino-6-(5-phosphoribosylamino)uracil reductase